MNPEFETAKCIEARAKVQAELDARPRVKQYWKEFTKTTEERKALRKEKTNYEPSMYNLFGNHWKQLSRMLGCLNVPSDPMKRQILQTKAERRYKDVRV